MIGQLELVAGSVSARWLPLRRAANELGTHFLTLRRGAESGRIPAPYFQVVETARGPRYLFDVDAIAGDPELRCTYPRCDRLAPGPSGRCGDHAAQVVYGTVELVCQWEPCGAAFTRPGSWLAEREGRGHYCSNRCKGLAHDDAHPGRLQNLNRHGARDHHGRVAERVAAEGKLDRNTAAAAHPHRYSPSRMGEAARAGDLASELRLYDGSVRRVFDPDDVDGWEPAWADQLERRANFAKARHGVAALRRIYGRLASRRGREHGNAPGPRPRTSPEQEKQVAWLTRRGRTQEAIAELVGISRKQVRRIQAELSAEGLGPKSLGPDPLPSDGDAPTIGPMPPDGAA